MKQRDVFTWIIALLAIVASAAAMAEEPLWIDVRTPDEYGQQHVQQALNIPYEEIGQEILSVTTDKDQLIHVYCRSGRRSGIAKETLDSMGYTRVVNVGGLDDALKLAGEQAETE